MRLLGYGLGMLLLIGAGACAVAEILRLLTSDSYEPVALGTIWFSIHGNSLVGFQALVEKSISPLLWSPIQQLLLWPGWLVLGVPGLILFLSCRSRQRGFENRF